MKTQFREEPFFYTLPPDSFEIPVFYKGKDLGFLELVQLNAELVLS